MIQSGRITTAMMTLG